MTFSFYIMRSYATVLLGVFGIVLALVLTIDTLDVLGSIRSERISFLDAVWLSSLRVPDLIVLVFPLIILISSLVFCLTLSGNSEFVISRAMGRPMLLTLLGPLVFSMCIAALVASTIGPLSSRLSDEYSEARARISGSLENRLQVTASGLWLREALGDDISVLNAASSFDGGDRLNYVTIFRFSLDGQLLERLEAQNGFLSDGQLLLTDVKIWDFSTLAANPELSAQQRNIMRFPTTLTSDQVLEGRPTPDTLFLWEFPSAIRALETSGSSSLSHQVFFLAQMALPIYYGAMFLLGACFSLQTSRMGKRGLAVMGAISLGFLLFFFQRTVQTFGEAGELPLLVATLSPSLAGFLGGLAWLLRKEDG